MNKKDKTAHRAMASSMDYFELTSTISSIICEKRQLAPHFTKQELTKYDDLIDVYENERKMVIYLLTSRNISTLIH